MSLPVFFETTEAAVVEATEAGAVVRYSPAWRADPDAIPLSLTMPLAQPEHPPEVVTPWLMNLLPEGEPLRAMTRAVGVSRDDILGLIAETGRDLAGAFTIGRSRSQASPGFTTIATLADLERIIEELPARPFLIGEEGVSMSLAGAQDKLPLALRDGGLVIPTGGAASTHILKPDIPRLPGSVQNEALCMVLARRCGLSVAEVTTGEAGRRAYLLVTRYDRFGEGEHVQRLHQEDFCQALGRPPAAKYQHNQSGVPGPPLAELFGLVRDRMNARDINRLIDAVIFNIAIGNVDSHAKNYAILLGATGQAAVAPLYDLMSGLDWPHITENHAQDIGGQRRGRHIYGRHWRRMAQETGLSAPGTLRRVRQVVERLLKALPAAVGDVAAMPAGRGVRLDRFEAAIGERARLVLDHAAVEGPAEPESPDDAAADPAASAYA
jgi:serine/threonine-protein kinase HipA